MSIRLKILLVVSEAPPITSGVARCTESLSLGLRRRGHHVDVISSNDVPRWTMGEFRLSSFVWHWPQLALSLPSYDVVNLHGPVPSFSDAFLALFRSLPSLSRPALVYTHHSSIDLRGWGLACDAYGWLHDRLARTADRIVVSSESYRSALSKAGEVDVVPWGVDLARHASPPRVRRDPHLPLRVLFVGQLRPYKGVDHLVGAVAGESRLRLSIAGDGPLASRYHARAEALNAENIDFLGRVSDRKLLSLYRQHDVIALPSTTRAEAFGLVLLEGMATGCVPVASDLPGVRDLAGPTGALVRPADVDSLRGTLLGLAGDPPRLAQLSNASRQRASTMGWGAVATRYEHTFRMSVRANYASRAALAFPGRWSSPERMLDLLVRRFGASWGSILLFDQRMTPRGAWGRASVDAVRSRRVRIAEYVARTGRPLVLDSNVSPMPVRGWLMRDKVGSALWAPLRSRHGTAGVVNLSLAVEEHRRYSDDHLAELRRLVAS